MNSLDRDFDGSEAVDTELKESAAKARAGAWAEDRRHFQFIISLGRGDRIEDLRAYVREVIGRFSGIGRSGT